MNEIWKNIKGYGNYYQVSNKGRVKSVDRFVPHGRHGKVFRKGKIRKAIITKHGYHQVSLKYNGKTSTQLIHRLMALAFLDNPENYPCVNHKDGDKANNILSNIEWCTYSENITHAISTGLLEIASGRKSLNNKPIIQLDLDGNKINEYYSATKASKYTGLSRSNICRSARDNKTAGGFAWVYSSDFDEMDRRQFQSWIHKANEYFIKFQNHKKSVLKLDLTGKVIKEYESLNAASQETDLDVSTISKVARGKRKSTGGYMWIFA